MRNLNVLGLVALGLLLASGVGGGLGALALGHADFAASLLGFAAGAVSGLLMPQVPLRRQDGQE